MSWKCQRQSKGEKCGYVNPSLKRLCVECGKPRPPRKRPAHMAALDIPYEEYIVLNGGEFCAICGVGPSPARRLDRDHDHTGLGRPRGLLCHFCNRRLDDRVTPEWLRAAADYLERTSG